MRVGSGIGITYLHLTNFVSLSYTLKDIKNNLNNLKYCMSHCNHSQNLYFLPSGTTQEFNVVIEIPYGSQNKYELDPKTGAIFLDRVLYSSEFYPFNYGFIPSTKAPDGDAFDVAVFLTNPVPAGCVVKARAIGIIKKIDSGDQDDCILAVPTNDPRFKDIKEATDLQPHILVEIQDFFACYKRLQNKTCIVEGVFGRDIAEAEITAHLNNYPIYTEKTED